MVYNPMRSRQDRPIIVRLEFLRKRLFHIVRGLKRRSIASDLKFLISALSRLGLRALSDESKGLDSRQGLWGTLFWSHWCWSSRARLSLYLRLPDLYSSQRIDRLSLFIYVQR